MSDSTTNKITMACTVITTAVVIWQQATGVPATWVTYACTFVAGFGFGYSVRYFTARRRPDWFSGLDKRQLTAIAILYDAREPVTLEGHDLALETLAKLEWGRNGAGWPVAERNDSGGAVTWRLTEGARSVVAENEGAFRAELEKATGKTPEQLAEDAGREVA